MKISEGYLLKNYDIGEEHSKELEKMLLSLEIEPKITVLDIGCGSGRNSIFLASLGFETYAIDLSKNAVKLANDRSKIKGYNIKTSINNFTDLRFEKNYFDLIIGWRVFHIGDHNINQKAINEARRVLKKNGYALIAVASASGIVYEQRLKDYGFSAKNTISYPSQNSIHTKHYFTKEELTDFFKGFIIEDYKIITEFSGHNNNIKHDYWALKMRKIK
jgi:ubiquinone/menaquinone biosynthesis C-methylase UbiE